MDFIRTHLPIHEAYEVADWLKHDAYLATHDGRGDDAIEECRAILNVGRALGDDRGFFSHRTRVGMQWGCKHTAERVLGQGTASDESLAALQDLLTREAAESNWLHVLRGERAGHHHLFENVRTGKVAIFEMLEPEQEPVDVLAVAMQVVPVCMLPYYPEHLRTMNRAIEIARLPLHEQKAKLTALDQEVAAQGGPLAGRLLGKFVKIWESECRSQAIVRTHLVALACERYRLKHANWPAALEVLVKEKYLAAVPCDPFDGEPLRYRLEEDCVAVYSIGIDAKDDHGQTDHNPFERAPDIGFRLWNESHRRAAPQPPVVLPEGNRQP